MATLRFGMMAKKIKLYAIKNEIAGSFDHFNEVIDRLTKLAIKPILPITSGNIFSQN